MKRLKFLPFLLLCLSAWPLGLLAQASPESPASSAGQPVQEQELSICLKTELQARERFAELEKQATELRGTEELLKEQRAALGREKAFLDSRRPEAERVNRYNDDIREFNLRTDQLNTAKDTYQQDFQAYNTWINTQLKPACDKLNGRPVAPVTSYHACEYQLASSKLQQLPHCSTITGLNSLRTCVSKAGSKAKAQETCN